MPQLLNITKYLLLRGKKEVLLEKELSEEERQEIRNVDELTSTSRRIDLGQICSISDHKS